MNLYVRIINNTVDLIEDRINEKLTLASLAQQFNISDFHFNRMFKTITGFTLKQYILGRKLTKSLELLKKTEEPIIDIAYDLSFEYPEVFSRAFKKQYGISPTEFRGSAGALEGIQRVNVIERDIVNYGGLLAVKGTCKYVNEYSLTGISIQTNIYDDDYREKLEERSRQFVIQSSGNPSMRQDYYYTVVNCNGEDTGDYTVFCGRRLAKEEAEMPESFVVSGDFDSHQKNANSDSCLISDSLDNLMLSNSYKERVIPGGWYVSFRYQGDMFRISENFIDELYRWIMVKEAELNPNGIGMLNIYPQSYEENPQVEILVPIKKPV